ncbi:pirin family protein [Spongiactinospora sp. TRM90649]|uniref:pirin family protein n=1 Tax=Spongiactinospora sp. TRM90649 TaxID=3031114 RepID=UPI0023F6E15E|nr:pirin family protein [Spongiactinospora sp. TRM90649]MDF5751491.1 pirin family protein [Spongiactinospora sp. TRM90649]
MDVVQRTVVRIETKTRLGPDAQVDDKCVIISPTRPELTDPFLVLSEDWFSSPGFEWHPHRGLETVTMVLDGVLEHGDSAGNAGVLTTGDVQWMTAGKGVIHRELAFRDERAHTLQLWVNLPGKRKLTGTRYQDLLAVQRPVIERDGARIDLISGEADGVTGPATNEWPISGTIITLEPGRRLSHVLPGRDRAFLYVLDGRFTIAGRAVRAGQIAWSDPVPSTPVSSIALEAGDRETRSVVMVYSGPPIREHVAIGGPFVMNTQAEIDQAFRDFRRGGFGQIPRQARLQYI